ncbi:MBL fold metallo-hydrolase [Massilia cavernae]|uniref:MBL fold metallo-hydrolase n=1 Tax=Massilia cavernae TaxID=2320864 RepID=UPI001E2D2319|nr:MBL fold metallo-hydrolase [Massilia cavernae]
MTRNTTFKRAVCLAQKNLSGAAIACAFAVNAVASDNAAQSSEPPLGKSATAQTAARNAAVLQQLPFTEREDFASVKRGLIAPFKGDIKNAAGRIVWSLNAYEFEQADKSPDTVNPSLWRLAQLNAHAGLFKVTDRVYQVRGLDLSNMTIIESDTGLIIIDPLSFTETARAAIDLYYQHRPKKPVLAVIYSHSHADHFGGVRGVWKRRRVQGRQGGKSTRRSAYGTRGQ